MRNSASKNKLFTKIIFLVEFIILVTSTLFCTVSIYRARVGIRKAIQQRMLDISNTAAAMLDGVLERVESELGMPAASVVVTGESAGVIVPNCRRGGISIDEDLVMYGLWRIWRRNRGAD